KIIEPSGASSEKSPQIFRWSKPSNLGGAEFVWYDLAITGPESRSMTSLCDTSVIVGGLPVGSYNYTVVAHSLIGSSIASGSFQIVSLGVNELAHYAPSFQLTPNPATRTSAAFA